MCFPPNMSHLKEKDLPSMCFPLGISHPNVYHPISCAMCFPTDTCCRKVSRPTNSFPPKFSHHVLPAEFLAPCVSRRSSRTMSSRSKVPIQFSSPCVSHQISLVQPPNLCPAQDEALEREILPTQRFWWEYQQANYECICIWPQLRHQT